MAKATDEEFKEIEAGRRHKELVASIGKLSEREELAPLFERLATAIAESDKDETGIEEITTTFKGIAKDLSAIREQLSKKRRFTILRNSLGLMEAIVVE